MLEVRNDMKRSEVIEHVVLMPMKIKTQWEGDVLVAVMPAWNLPTNLIVKAKNLRDALDKLEALMRKHWGTPSDAERLYFNGE
jgi:hypothetical protein